jgi:hypothetical protein
VYNLESNSKRRYCCKLEESRSNGRTFPSSQLTKEILSDFSNVISHFCKGQTNYTEPAINLTAIDQTPLPLRRLPTDHLRQSYQSREKVLPFPGLKIITLHEWRSFKTLTTNLESTSVSPEGYGLPCLEHPLDLKMEWGLRRMDPSSSSGRLSVASLPRQPIGYLTLHLA